MSAVYLVFLLFAVFLLVTYLVGSSLYGDLIEDPEWKRAQEAMRRLEERKR